MRMVACIKWQGLLLINKNGKAYLKTPLAGELITAK